MTQPIVSVIVPVHDGQDSIARCLDSIFKQDYGLIETIVIDDASSDDSLARVKRVSSERPNVQVIAHETNQGLASTLNEGIARAQGDFVLAIHQDCELLEPSFVRRALTVMQEHPDIGAVTGRRVYPIRKFSSNEKLFMVANGHLTEMEHNGYETEDLTFVEDKCDLYRKSLLNTIGGFPAHQFRVSGEDQVASSRMRARGYRLVKLGAVSYRLDFGRKESTLRGILEKLRVYGRTQAGVLWTVRGSAIDGLSKENGLKERAFNRVQMLLSAGVIVAGLLLSVISPFFLLLSLGAFIGRSMTYVSGLGKLNGHLKLALLGPLLDFSYSIGFVEGLVFSSMGRRL